MTAQVNKIRDPLWKRVEDLCVAVPAIIISAPVLVAAAFAIAVEDGPPILFWDERVGLGGRTFRVAKLRTMVRDATERGLGRAAAADDDRITKVGRLLRRLSLDELPQLWAVIVGDMSIVGPRPTIPEQVRRYAPRHLGRLRVRPGVTGLAQVNGRNDLPWSRRIDYDLDYVDRLSPLLDIRILIQTPFVVMRGAGLYGARGVTPDYDSGEESS